MKTLFVTDGKVLKEVDGILVLRNNDFVHLEGERWYMLSDSIIDLNNETIINYIWNNPYSDK
jgi:hypothetical protein